MVSRVIIFIALLFLLFSCAQVGTISGGPEDIISPQIKEMNPPNETVKFSSKSIEIEFEEFIKLNNPTQSISVIPPDFKVKTEVSGKTLTLSWEEELQSNTTYSIFLNKTVQDITETNDSILQIVFSTGEYLDSLSYSTYVKDVNSQQAEKGVLVGLFAHEDSLEPMYFAQTDASGKANFNYLKSGTYFVRAFEDVNKDLKISKTERIAFNDHPIMLMDSTIVDSIPLTIFTPPLIPNIRTFQFQAPGAYVVGATYSLKDAIYSINGEEIPSEFIEQIQSDSIRFYYTPKEQKSLELVVSSPIFIDTTSLRMTDASKNKLLTIQPPKLNRSMPSEKIVFTVYDKIEAVDTSLIQLMSLPDSTIISNYMYEINAGRLEFELPPINSEKVAFSFKSNAIVGATGQRNVLSTQLIRTFQEKEVGVLNLDLTEYTVPIILEVLLAGKMEQKIHVSPTSKLKLNDLVPGEYTFKIVIDENNNALWDTGNFEMKTQPEDIQHFTDPTTVRANWEIELKLVPKDE